MPVSFKQLTSWAMLVRPVTSLVLSGHSFAARMLLPTGAGNSLCFVMLPRAFDNLLCCREAKSLLVDCVFS